MSGERQILLCIEDIRDWPNVSLGYLYVCIEDIGEDWKLINGDDGRLCIRPTDIFKVVIS